MNRTPQSSFTACFRGLPALPLLVLLGGLFLSTSALGVECANGGAGANPAGDDEGFEDQTACGRNAKATAVFSTAIGSDAVASGVSSTALGAQASAIGSGSTALGLAASASTKNSTALGKDALAFADASTALGRSASALVDNSTALGVFASASGINSTAIGNRASVNQANALVLGSIPGINDGSSINPYVDVGIGTNAPLAPLHIQRTDNTFEFLYLDSDLAGGSQDRPMMKLVNNGGIRFQFDNTGLGTAWRFQAATGNQDNFEVTKVGTGKIEMRLDATGNLTIQGILDQNSDVNAKEGIEAVDARAILSAVTALPISQWRYRGDQAVHLGPMAQDFHAAFGLGADKTKLAPGDLAGVALAAIQAQQQAMDAKSEQIADQQERIARLEGERAERYEQIARIQQQNEQLKGQQAERDAQIAALTDRLDEVDELRAALAALKTELGGPALAMD